MGTNVNKWQIQDCSPGSYLLTWMYLSGVYKKKSCFLLGFHWLCPQNHIIDSIAVTTAHLLLAFLEMLCKKCEWEVAGVYWNDSGQAIWCSFPTQSTCWKTEVRKPKVGSTYKVIMESLLLIRNLITPMQMCSVGLKMLIAAPVLPQLGVFPPTTIHW